MTEQTGLATLSNDLVPEKDSFLKELTTSSAFTPTLKLFVSQSSIVAEGKFPMNHWGVQKSKDDIVDLGKNVDVIFYTRRYKAVEKVGGEYISFYDPQSEGFQRAKEKAKVKNSGSLCGIEYLGWIPSLSMFVIYYANSWSALQIANEIIAMFNKPATMGSKPYASKTYKWVGPNIIACATELSGPTQEDLDAEAKKFLNPKSSTKEVDTDEAPAGAEDRR
jgi:hypothetical protein